MCFKYLKMYKLFIFFLIFCVKFLYATKECNDCVVYTSCPNAADQAKRNENPTGFRNAFCGFDYTSQPKLLPKVCCSDFGEVKLKQRFSEPTTAITKAECDDCVAYTSCPKALESFEQRKNQIRFKNSICGYDSSQPGRPVSKVCCSAFDDAPIERHPNVNLLPSVCGAINGRRIIGGSIASLYEFPWMALISYRMRTGPNFGCGGSIISSRYILTAAHCVSGKNIAGVRVGEHNIQTREDCEGSGVNYICEKHIQDIAVKNYTVHEDYDRASALNDIALLLLADEIDFSHRNVAPICLPTTESLRTISLDNEIGTVAGWGLVDHGRETSVLRKVDIPVKEKKTCDAENEKSPYIPDGFPRQLTTNQICAGQRGKDSCEGDSGGPLMLQSEYQDAFRIVQYGIVSYGPRDCGFGLGVYTAVHKYMNWILDNMTE